MHSHQLDRLTGSRLRLHSIALSFTRPWDPGSCWETAGRFRNSASVWPVACYRILTGPCPSLCTCTLACYLHPNARIRICVPDPRVGATGPTPCHWDAWVGLRGWPGRVRSGSRSSLSARMGATWRAALLVVLYCASRCPCVLWVMYEGWGGSAW